MRVPDTKADWPLTVDRNITLTSLDLKQVSLESVS
jgi:hypothetical protein